MSSHFYKIDRSETLLDASLAKHNDLDILNAGEKNTGFYRQPTCNRIKFVALLFAGCCLGLVWILSSCISVSSWKLEEAHSITSDSPSFDLIKYQASPPTPSATGVLECFQVYQPVLTPSGATDETVLIDGSQDTTAIAPVALESSCDVVLMEHDFAFSYGIPFVGELWPKSIHSMTDWIRKLYTTKMQIQSSDYEFHCYF
jgi:hypothetical protein